MNVVSVAEELNFKFYLLLNNLNLSSRLWLVTAVLGSVEYGI